MVTRMSVSGLLTGALSRSESRRIVSVQTFKNWQAFINVFVHIWSLTRQLAIESIGGGEAATSF
ncbi:hypothetical protein ABT297_31690 [Dactylosporangium sp. NPDC000555]|uniref:hypothetical protein n=1 Tax=Dactylosporangium sp. NPDC000555 TaxID=3154260 RepID=UPI00332927D0